MSTENATPTDTTKPEKVETETKVEGTAEEASESSKRPRSPSAGEVSDDKKESKDNNNNSNQNKNNRNKKAKTKKEAAKNHTWRGWDAKVDNRERPPHEGSYASPALREEYGISLDGRIDTDKSKTVKRKVALFLGFLGTRYGGFQVNLGQRTLQAEIELALYKAGMLAPLNFGHPYKYSWSTSARTDKGVHACAQVSSLKVELMESDLEDMEQARKRVESFLPDDIRLLDMQRTTRNFCAKTQRDRVRYQYMIPSFLLYPDYRSLLTKHGIPLEGRKDVAKAPLTKEELDKLQEELKQFRSTTEQRTLLQSAFRKYEGTHPFHNFTKGIKPGQATANRYIQSFNVEEPVIIDGLEWLPTQVLGQSFLLHQIRKMVAMAVDVGRGAAPLELMDKALDKKEIVRVGLAPAQGLFLELSFYQGYNRRKQQNQDLPDLDWSVPGPAKDRWSSFRDTIREHIVQEEESQGNFIQYLYVQECIFEYRKFYGLEGNDNDDDDDGVKKEDGDVATKEATAEKQADVKAEE